MYRQVVCKEINDKLLCNQSISIGKYIQHLIENHKMAENSGNELKIYLNISDISKIN